MNYDNQAMVGGGAYAVEKMAQMPSLAQRLDMAVKQSEERLAAAKEARDIFQRNPDLERLLNLMQGNFF